MSFMATMTTITSTISASSSSSSSSSSSTIIFRVLSTTNPHNSHYKIFKTSQPFVGTSKSSSFKPLLLHSNSSFLPLYPFSNTDFVCSAKRSSKTKKVHKDNLVEEDDINEDALEALFSQLEEDLKNDNQSADDGDEDISEEDLAMLEKELADAFGELDEDEISEDTNSTTENLESNNDDDDDDNDIDDDEEEKPLKLKTWQFRRLANALKIGKRKTSIKNLAGELGLDRAVVLELLREPPPELLLMGASLSDKITPSVSVTESKSIESLQVEVPRSEPVESSTVAVKPKAEVKEPVHVMRQRWVMQKRLKKVQLETLERVYLHTKRPTNAMISSIVHLTNLPRKRVINWFEEKRQEDRVPDQRRPYRRQMVDTVSTN